MQNVFGIAANASLGMEVVWQYNPAGVIIM